MIRFASRIRLKAAAGGQPRKLFIVGYTGVPLWLVNYKTPVVVDLAGLLMPTEIPVLADHENSLAAVVGGGKPSTDGKTLIVNGVVADTAVGREVVKMLESGAPLQASIGSDPLETRPVHEGESVEVNGRTLAGPFLLCTKTQLREITVCAMGADQGTSTTLAARRRAEGTAMTFEEWVTSLGLDPATVSEETMAALQKAYDAEYGTSTEPIEEPATNAAARPVSITGQSAVAIVQALSRCGQDVMTRAFAQGWTVEQAQRYALADLRASRPNGPSPITRAAAMPDGKKTIEAATLIKAGFEKAAVKAYGEQVAEAARPLARKTMLDLAAASLRATGKPVPHDREDMIRAAMSGGDLSVSLGNSANKIAEAVWREAEPTWRSWCAIRSAADFKTNNSLRPSFGGVLTPTGSGGEIDHGTVSEENITWKVHQFAKYYSISRQDLTNDDAGVFSEIVPGMTRAAARGLSDLVYFTLLNGLSTQFTVGRTNTQSSGGSVLSSTSLSVAIKQMRKQTDPSGSFLNLTPAVLVVGPDLEQTARPLLNSAEVLRDQENDLQPVGNVHQGVARLEVEPRVSLGCRNPNDNTLASGSLTQWLLFASPMDMPMIVGFLGGKESPTVETFNMSADPKRLAMTWRIFHDFGAALGDYRAGQYSAGA